MIGALIGTIALALLGWAALYMAMDRPRLARSSAVDTKLLVMVLRIIGALLLLWSLVCSMQAYGATVGFTAWWIWLALTAFGFALWRSLTKQ